VSSKLEICNLALDRLAIASLTDVNSFTGDEIGKLCDRTYEQGRNFLLWLHHWNFSIRRISAVTADVVDKLHLQSHHLKIIKHDTNYYLRYSQ
jgi:hypothetical protein